MWLTRISILRPVFITMVVLGLVVLGLRSMKEMVVELNPRIDLPFVTVVTIYPGAGPEEIETLITDPIEEAVSSINGVKSLTSNSLESQSIVMIEFELGRDVNQALSDVREKVDAVRRALPREVEPPILSKFDIASQPILFLAASSPRPLRELKHLIEKQVKDRLSQVEGVAAVTVTGGESREIQVRVDKARLEAYGLSITQVAQGIALANLNLPSGTIKESRREYAVRVLGEFESPEELRHVYLSFPGGPTGRRRIRLSEIATVVDTVAERQSITRLNQQESVGILVQKTSDANTVEVVDGIREELNRLEGETNSHAAPAEPGALKKKWRIFGDVDVIISQDQSKLVRAALDDITTHLILAIILVVFVIFVFLHNLRGVFIVSIAIPTCLIATFLVIHFAGFTLNQMVMLGLTLAIGILVDDSIVVLENIYRHLHIGEGPREAAYNGRSEIGLAAIAITLTDVVVFVPIAFMGGIVGRFFREFGITVATATLFSLFISFTLTPMLASRWYRRGEETEAKRGLFAHFDRFYHALDRFYRGLLAWALQNRYLTIFIGVGTLLAVLAIPVPRQALPVLGSLALLIGLLALPALLIARGRQRLLTVGALVAMLAVTFGVKRFFGFQFTPPMDQGQVGITVEMPAGTRLEVTDRVIQQIEDLVSDLPEVENVFTNVGLVTGGFRGAGESGGQYGQVMLTLVDRQTVLQKLLPFLRSEHVRTRSDAQIAAELRQRLPSFPGALLKVTTTTGFGGMQAPLQIELRGHDTRLLNDLALRMRDQLKEVPGILNPDVSWRVGRPEVQVRIDRVRAADLGFSVSQIAATLRDALEGNTMAKYREAGDEYDIRVQLAEFDRRRLADVADIILGTVDGQIVRLRDVASVEIGSGPTRIDRADRQRQVQVLAYLAPGFPLGNVEAEIRKRGITDIRAEGVTLHWGGQSEIMRESAGHMFSALGLAIVLVYMLMAALFESFLNPFIIMLSLPMALIGALVALVLTGQTMSIISMIGFIMLVGLVTKNAILLIDYTNTLRGRGKSRNEAILEAGPTRLRPILMTTLALALALLPIASGMGEAAELRQSMAIAVIGGLLLSTLLTLVVIPVVYTLFDDLAAWLRRLKGRVVGRGVMREA